MAFCCCEVRESRVARIRCGHAKHNYNDYLKKYRQIIISGSLALGQRFFYKIACF